MHSSRMIYGRVKEVRALHNVVQNCYFLMRNIQICYQASANEIKIGGHRVTFGRKRGQ